MRESDEDIELNNEIDDIDFYVELDNEEFDDAINNPDYKPNFKKQKPIDTDENEETNNIRRYPTREYELPERYQINNIQFVTNKETIKRQKVIKQVTFLNETGKTNSKCYYHKGTSKHNILNTYLLIKCCCLLTGIQSQSYTEGDEIRSIHVI